MNRSIALIVAGLLIAVGPVLAAGLGALPAGRAAKRVSTIR